MYAIIQTGGKQYRVQKGDTIDVELLEEGPSQAVEFADVLLFNDGSQTLIGAPMITGCTVKGEVLDHVRGPKVIAFKYKKRKKYRRKVGHRQGYARVKITDILR